MIYSYTLSDDKIKNHIRPPRFSNFKQKSAFQITCDLLFKMIILFNASIETLSQMQPV